MEMAATGEEGLESLIRNFKQMYQGFKDAISEIQTLKLNYSYEIRRCEAVEVTCNDLRTDNERLRRLYTESLTKLTSQCKPSEPSKQNNRGSPSLFETLKQKIMRLHKENESLKRKMQQGSEF